MEEAIADWTEAILLDPNDAVAYMNRGVAKSDLGDKQGAILGKPGAPLPKSDYDRFVEDFLKFVSYERETLGEEKFAQRFPLEGFDDWRRKRKSVK